MRKICCAYQDGSVRVETAREVFASRDVFNGRAIFAEHFEHVFVVAVEMVIERFSADSASYPLRPVLAPEHDYVTTGVRPFFRSREDQFLVFPRYLPRREFARPNLQTGEISLMQAEEIGLGHFPESPLLIRRNVAFHPLGDMSTCLFPIHAPPHHVPHELTQRLPMQLFEWIGIAEGLPL